MGFGSWNLINRQCDETGRKSDHSSNTGPTRMQQCWEAGSRETDLTERPTPAPHVAILFNSAYPIDIFNLPQVTFWWNFLWGNICKVMCYIKAMARFVFWIICKTEFWESDEASELYITWHIQFNTTNSSSGCISKANENKVSKRYTCTLLFIAALSPQSIDGNNLSTH